MRILRDGLLFAVAVVCATACSHGAGVGSAQRHAGQPTLGMVTDIGGLGDKSFNDSAYRGLQRAQSQLGTRIAVLQSRSVSDYEPNLSTLAQQGDALVFAIGFLMHDSLADVAAQFPQSHFAIIDSVVDAPNVTSVTFREEQSSFLAGVVAGLVTKTGSVGFLGGIQSPLIEKFEAGFTAGVHSINPKTQVLVKYTGSFDDVASGKEFASVLFDQGADIIYAAAGKCGLGAIDEVRSKPDGYYIIGVDSDQDALAPGKVLTSALKHVDNAVYALAIDASRGKVPAGHIVLGLREGGVGLTSMRYTKAALPPDGSEVLAVYERAIISGRIAVPATQSELAAFHPVSVQALR